MHILWFLLFGVVVCALARALRPQAQGWVIPVLMGVDAVFGSYFGRVIGLCREGRAPSLIFLLLAPISTVVVYRLLVRRGSRTVSTETVALDMVPIGRGVSRVPNVVQSADTWLSPAGYAFDRHERRR